MQFSNRIKDSGGWKLSHSYVELPPRFSLCRFGIFKQQLEGDIYGGLWGLELG
jgi:hypothetical protein